MITDLIIEIQLFYYIYNTIKYLRFDVLELYLLIRL